MFKNKTKDYMNIGTAKEKEKLEKCLEIKKCQTKFDSLNLHKKCHPILITDGPPFLEGEVQAALKNAKDQKALGPDGIPAVILKLIEGSNLGWLARVFNVIYDMGVIPTEWDLKIIINLYCNQRACVRVERETTEEIQVLRGVRQRCILSPVISNLYSENIFSDVLQDIEARILLYGERLNNIRYADDTIIFADNLASLPLLLDSITSYSRQDGLEINTNKTKYLIISKNQNTRCTLLVDGTPSERVNKYTYLGTNVSDNWGHSEEIRTLIEKARTAFIRMKKVFTIHDLQLATKNFAYCDAACFRPFSMGSNRGRLQRPPP
ncbi:hypothetical protein HUJ05_007814 [Dendroctonus ponderosae]|nr:hypothetical protein HUJ05_007814 [Dendroctonus ponderosae]